VMTRRLSSVDVKHFSGHEMRRLQIHHPGFPECSERRGAARSRGHGQGNLPSGHKRTMTKKVIAKIKTINHAGRKPRSTGKCCPQTAQRPPADANHRAFRPVNHR
jgi:hypothetical protein